jgi:diamine N-acetyltransferase
MAIIIREGTPEDSALIATLNADVQAIHATGLPDMFKPPLVSEELITNFKSQFGKPESFFLIGELDEQPSGYLSGEFQRRVETPRHHAFEMIYVHHISVRPESRRKGLGRALLDAAQKLGRQNGIERMALDVWKFNQASRLFFASYGLQVYNEKMWMSVR